MNNIFNKIIRLWSINWNFGNLSKLALTPELTPIRDLPKRINGARVFLVGGSVRDFLLGGVPKDFDVCISGATTEQVQKYLESFPGAKVVFAGSTFPVFKFRAHEDAPELDIALARTEQSLGGGKLQDFVTQYDPTVTIEDDLSRRDFTWNALALELTTGKLIDPWNGIADLKAGVINTVGDAITRFTEDRTRALRALRFAVKLKFSFENKTWKAVCDFAPRMNEMTREGEYILKRELAGREFLKTLDANPVEACKLWDKSGMFDSLIPEVSLTKKILQRPDFHPEGDVFVHTLIALGSLSKKASLNLKLAVLLHDLGKATRFQVFDRETKKEIAVSLSPAEFCAKLYNAKKHLIKNIDHEKAGVEIGDEIIRRLAMTASGIDADHVKYLIREHMFHGLPSWKLSKIESLLFDKSGDPIWDMYEMARADACGSHKNYEFANTVKKYINDLLALREEASKRPPKLLDGNEIMSEFALKPGPQIKELLELVREKQLDELAAGRIFTRKEALEFLKTKI
ncbi:MAG: hypothetical protein WCJ29_05380 [bacterium]